MTATTEQRERAAIREALEARRAARQVQAVLDRHAAERLAERDGERDAQQGQTPTMTPADRKRLRELAATRRRDELRRALDYPMTADDIIDASLAATTAAKVPEGERLDVAAELRLLILRRHGCQPRRCDVSAAWLNQWAVRINQRLSEKRERVTGMREAAQELGDLDSRRNREALADLQGGDLVYAHACNSSADEIRSVVQVQSAPPHFLAHVLGVHGKAAEALAVAIDNYRLRPLTGAERERQNAALRVLRQMYPTPEAVRLTVRPDSYAVAALVDRAIGAERERAAVGARGGHLPGARRPASPAPLARFTRQAGPSAAESGGGYGGALTPLLLAGEYQQR